MGLFSSVWKGVVDVHKLLGSAIPGVGQYLSSQESIDAQKDTNDKNLQAIRETNAANAALWREQSEYNTPLNQVKRLEAAGLNPNLAYGQVADSKAATPITMQAPRYQSPGGHDYSGFGLAEYAQVVNLMETNKLIQAQAKKAAVEADYASYEADALKRAKMLKSDAGSLGGLFRYLFRDVVGGNSLGVTLQKRDYNDR